MDRLQWGGVVLDELIRDRWSGTALVRQRRDRWTGAALVQQARDAFTTTTLGMYMGYDASAAVTSYATTNNLPIVIGSEFGDGFGLWSWFTGGTNFGNWSTWVAASPGRRLHYSSPLLTANDDAGLTQAQKYAKLAAGDYDVHFTTLGNTFQSYPNLRNAIVRLGWEFNGNTFPWKVPPGDQVALDNYKTGFNRAAAAMKAACPTLEIEWCPNTQLDYTGRTFADMYPGDAWIDYIGIGLYDYCWDITNPTQAQREAWLRDNPNGLQDQVTLASARGKRLAHAEWGMWPTTNGNGGGDRPEFITFIAAWYRQHGYSFTVYNNGVGTGGDHQLDSYPNAKAAFLTAFR